MSEVDLGSSIRGRLFLHSMPGWWEDSGKFLEELAHGPVTLVVSLASREEIKRKRRKRVAVPGLGQRFRSKKAYWSGSALK